MRMFPQLCGFQNVDFLIHHVHLLKHFLSLNPHIWRCGNKPRQLYTQRFFKIDFRFPAPLLCAFTFCVLRLYYDALTIFPFEMCSCNIWFSHFLFVLMFVSTEEESSGTPYHRERRNAISSQAQTHAALDRSANEEPTTSTEEHPSLLKKELHGSLPHLTDHALPYRGTLFAMDHRNGYLDSHYRKCMSHKS